MFKMLEKANKALEKFDITKNKSGNKPYADVDDVLIDIVAKNKVYEASLREISAVEKDSTLSSQERIEKLDKLYSTFAHTVTDLSRTINTYRDAFNGNLDIEIDSKLTKNGVKSLKILQNQLEDYYGGILGYIAVLNSLELYGQFGRTDRQFT